MVLAFCAVFAALGLRSAKAQQSEVWTCTYTAPDATPVLVRFTVDGETLWSTSSTISNARRALKITANNEYGIVAASSLIDRIAPNMPIAEIAGELVIIDRRVASLTWGLVSTTGQRDIAYRGKCIKG